MPICALLRRLALSAISCPPIPRHVEGTGPHAAAGNAGFVFLGDVIDSIFPKRNRPALGDHPGVEIGVTLEADSYDTAIAVMSLGMAGHGRTTNHVCQSEG